jgi:sugar transferase EpsL
MTWYQQRGKRLLDVAFSAVALVVLSPVLVVVAAVVAVTLGRPVLFTQQRPSRLNCPFTIVKFRTMTDARDSDGELLPDAERLTRVGRFLRATSLDELPELWNVVRGDMSLVGPRPLLQHYVRLYTPQQAQRAQVRPGITGLAQVNGRNHATWQQRLADDVHYVRHYSLAMDLSILWRTVGAVLRRRGIAAQGHATMPAFTGDEPTGVAS